MTERQYCRQENAAAAVIQHLIEVSAQPAPKAAAAERQQADTLPRVIKPQPQMQLHLHHSRMRNMPSVSETYSGAYLKAGELKGQEVPLTIATVKSHTFAEGERPKLVVSFKGTDKTLVLNKTNANRIASFCGDLTEDWPGNKVVLYADKVNFKGDYVDAIRVKVPPRVTESAQPAEAVDLKEEIDDEIPF